MPTEVKTITPLVATAYIADRDIPMNMLKILNIIEANVVFLKDRLSCRAVILGRTIKATTSIVPITFIERTIVVAINISNIIDNKLTGIPDNLADSSSKVIDINSL